MPYVKRPMPFTSTMDTGILKKFMKMPWRTAYAKWVSKCSSNMPSES